MKNKKKILMIFFRNQTTTTKIGKITEYDLIEKKRLTLKQKERN